MTFVIVAVSAACKRRLRAARQLVSAALYVNVACTSTGTTDGPRGTGGAGEDGAPGPSEAGADAAPTTRHVFRRLQLSTEFVCEGATYADFDGDLDMDVAFGPRWYEGPSFTVEHEIYAPQPFDPKGYSDCFFLFSRDFDADGWTDILRVGFPGADASLFLNPGRGGEHWPHHVVVNVVDTESPAFTDLTGDGSPELVFAAGGRLVWAGPAATDPTAPWNLHALTPPSGFQAFTHGLGVGDVDNDRRPDVLEASGWWRQPASLQGDPIWERQLQTFGSGGAQMVVGDVDGDADGDVVASLEAHGYGLAWFEQSLSTSTPATDFIEHVIVPPLSDAGGIALHEPHALAVVDIDKDGDPDIVTGERFWGHVPAGAPEFGAPAHLYWFELVRAAGTVTFVPHLIDDASGVGTQITVGDVTSDGLDDILIANKKGAFLFIHEIRP